MYHVCVSVNYNVCKSARALCDLYISVINSECVTQLLINPIIRTRTRLLSGVYHHTRHILVSGSGYGHMHVTFWCQEVVTDSYTSHFGVRKWLRTYARHILVSGSGYGLIHVTFWCQEVVTDSYTSHFGVRKWLRTYIRHILVSGSGYGHIHVTFWCQEVVTDLCTSHFGVRKWLRTYARHILVSGSGYGLMHVTLFLFFVKLHIINLLFCTSLLLLSKEIPGIRTEQLQRVMENRI
jgi:hypothetical protein